MACAFRVGRTIRDDKEMTYWNPAFTLGSLKRDGRVMTLSFRCIGVGQQVLFGPPADACRQFISFAVPILSRNGFPMRPFRSWMFIRPSIQEVALLCSDSPLIPSFHNDNLKAGSDMLRTIALARVNKTLLNQALFEGKNSHWLKQTEPVKIGLPKRKLIFQPPILRCYVSFRRLSSKQAYCEYCEFWTRSIFHLSIVTSIRIESNLASTC